MNPVRRQPLLRSFRVGAVLLCSLAAGCAGTAPSSTAPPKVVTSPASSVTPAPSATPIHLGEWQLTLPVNSAGHLSGKAAVVVPAALTPPWLSRQTDGGLLFWAPAGGAHTPHSLHSRTELQSLTGFPAGQAGHRLTASVVVEQLPTVSRTIIIGQIHGDGHYSAAPFVLLEIRGDNLEVSVESKPKLQGSTGPSYGEVTTQYPLLSGVALGQEFSYSITTTSDQMTIMTEFGSAAQPYGAPVSVSVAVPSDWKGDEVRFSAGDYQQDVASSTIGGGRVVFYALAMH
jgi:hypothetical protein